MSIQTKSVWAVHERLRDDYVPFTWPEPVCTPLFSPKREIWGCDEDQVWAVKAIRELLWGSDPGTLSGSTESQSVRTAPGAEE